MQLCGRWLAAVSIASALALASPGWSHQQVSLEIDQLTVEISHHPNDPELYVQRGELHRLNRKWALAETDFRKAQELTPDDPDLLFHLGRLWFDAGDLRRARPVLDRFIAAYPDHVEGLVIRGRVLAALGGRPSAAADYDRVIALLDPPEPEHYLQRARWLVAEGGAHVDSALAGIDAGIARLGPLVTLVEFAIKVERGRAHYDAVLARFSELLPVLATRPDWLARRGDVLHEAGREREASAAYAEALTAIEGLSPKRRTIKATIALENRLRRLLGQK